MPGWSGCCGDGAATPADAFLAADAGSFDGAAVIQSTRNGGLNQQFTRRKVTYAGNDPHDYQLLARHSGKCVDVSTISTAARAPIHQWTCNPANQSSPLNQTWRLLRVMSQRTTIAADYQGRMFNSPNDVTLALPGHNW